MNDQPSNAERSLALLASIDRRLAEQTVLLRRLVGPLVATDEQLDGDKGDFVVPFDPRGWRGESCKGRRLSECPPEYLDALAKGFDGGAWKKRQDGDEKKAGWAELDAARCRGWATRLRDGWLPQEAPVEAPPAGGNPFARRPAVPAAPPPMDDADDF